MRSLLVSVIVAAVACGGGGNGRDAGRKRDGTVQLDAAPGATDGAGAARDVVALVDAPALDAAVDAPPADAVRDAATAADVVDAAAREAGGPDSADAPAAVPDATVDARPPALVTLAFTGKVATVANTPLGLDASARTAPVTGTFTYDARALDDRPLDPKRGHYQFGGVAFTFMVKGHAIVGSGSGIVETEDLDPDTFRFIDGPQGDAVARIMKLDGADAPALKLWIAITDSSGALLGSDVPPQPFPAIDITKTPHTFSLEDGNGTLLMQLDTLVNR